MPQTNAMNTVYSEADDAAINALNEVLVRSIRDNVEFAGRIFASSDGKRFAFTRPNRGARDDAYPGSRKPPPQLIGFVNVGTYHTHGGNFELTDEEVSPADALKAAFAREFCWIVTPMQRIIKFTPISVLLVDPNYDPSIDLSFDTRLQGVVEELVPPQYMVAPPTWA